MGEAIIGIGDEIMASGCARVEHARTRRRVIIRGARGEHRWHDMWQGLPYIVRRDEPVPSDAVSIRNGPQCRPYIRYPFTRQTGVTFTAWRARDHLGELALDAGDSGWARFAVESVPRYGEGPVVVIEPNGAAIGNPNKQWGFERWQELVRLRPGVLWLQMGPVGTRRLEGVSHIVTTFRQALAVMMFADGIVVPEGGLHHAAAVLGLPTLVLFGSVSPYDTVGYPWQINLMPPGNVPCGRWLPCQHCADNWKALMPMDVATTLDSMLTVPVATFNPRKVVEHNGRHSI
jgi:hypothetical protein